MWQSLRLIPPMSGLIESVKLAMGLWSPKIHLDSKLRIVNRRQGTRP
mgnify:CR=1 FL=1